MMTRLRFLVGVLALFTLFTLSLACDTQTPLTDAQKHYVGKWRSTGGTTVIEIRADGSADLKGPHRDFEGGAVTISSTSLSLKRGMVGETFPITSAPVQQPTTGKWVMMLDSDTFTRD